MKRTNIFICIILFLVLLNSSIVQNFDDSFNTYNSNEKAQKSIKTAKENGGGYLMNSNASFNWIDIASTGINMTEISDTDDYFQIVNINAHGWSFPFYETFYPQIYVSSNGWMSFTDAGWTGGSILDLPLKTDQNRDAAVLFSHYDLDPSQGGDIFYEFRGTSPNRFFVIEYHQIYNSYGDLVGDFQGIFYENGTIKFQYKDITCALDDLLLFIGLDHGDLTNYNVYEGSLPFNSLAIQFTFNQIKNPIYKMKLNLEEEYSWIVTSVNNTKMVEFLGSDWYYDFGYLSAPSYLDKMKFRIHSISENHTHLNVDYDRWDWLYRIHNFSDIPYDQTTISFIKKPNLYQEEKNLTNLFPAFLPTPTNSYLGNSNLTNLYERIFYDFNFNQTTISTFYYNNGHDYKLNARYNGSGFLEHLSVSLIHNDPYSEELIFQVEKLMSNSKYLTEFTLDFSIGDEFTWIIADLNKDKLSEYFGNNWLETIGMPLDSKPGYKFKISIENAAENSTHWDLMYDLWDSKYRFDEFSQNAENQDIHLKYIKDPWLAEENSNFPNLIPMLIPNPMNIYIENYPLDYTFQHDFSYHTQYQFYIENGSYYGNIVYNSTGVITSLEIYDFLDGEIILSIEKLKPEHITHFSMEVEENDNLYWLINQLESKEMLASLGKNWEEIFALPSGAKEWYKSKVQIDEISENITHWKIGYSIWDWIDEDNLFHVNSNKSDKVAYRKDPFNYTKNVSFRNLMPFFFPNPLDPYLTHLNNLDEKYLYQNDLSYNYYYGYPTLNEFYYSLSYSLITDRANLKIQGIYDSQGFLSFLNIFNSSSYKRIFGLTRISNMSKDNIIGMREGEKYYYDYYINQSSEYYDGGEVPNSFKIDIKHISSESDNKSIILLENSIMDSNGVWYEWDDPKSPKLFINPTEYNDLHNNYTKIAYNFIAKKFFIMPSNLDWKTFAPELEILFNEYYENITVTAMGNGILIEQFENHNYFNYTGEGMLNHLELKRANSTLLDIKLTSIIAPLNESDNENEDGKIPILFIHSPKPGSIYNESAPFYNISIVEENLELKYYTLDNGETNISFIENSGIINQDVWDKLALGNITITFYAIDEDGNIGFAEVIIIKKESYDPSNLEHEIDGPELFLIMLFIMVGVVYSIMISRKNSF